MRKYLIMLFLMAMSMSAFAKLDSPSWPSELKNEAELREWADLNFALFYKRLREEAFLKFDEWEKVRWKIKAKFDMRIYHDCMKPSLGMRINGNHKKSCRALKYHTSEVSEISKRVLKTSAAAAYGLVGKFYVDLPTKIDKEHFEIQVKYVNFYHKSLAKLAPFFDMAIREKGHYLKGKESSWLKNCEDPRGKSISKLAKRLDCRLRLYDNLINGALVTATKHAVRNLDMAQKDIADREF